MNKTIQIRSSEDQERAVEAIISLPAAPVHEVAIRKATSKRSAAQNSLLWYAMTIIGNSRGETKDDVHRHYKEKFLVRIFERDDIGFAEMIDGIRNCWKNGFKGESENMWKYIVDKTSTTDATVEQFAEYLTDIMHDAANHRISIPLRGDDDLLAMGRK